MPTIGNFRLEYCEFASGLFMDFDSPVTWSVDLITILGILGCYSSYLELYSFNICDSGISWTL